MEKSPKRPLPRKNADNLHGRHGIGARSRTVRDLLQLARFRTAVHGPFRSTTGPSIASSISFSNASPLRQTGLSVPVRPFPDDNHIRKTYGPIEVIRSDGVYKNQTNPKEAADVAPNLILCNLLGRSVASPRSAVVTFQTVKQAGRYRKERALKSAPRTTLSFRGRADAPRREPEPKGGEDMGFFLCKERRENVQGDERDRPSFFLHDRFGPERAWPCFGKSFRRAPRDMQAVNGRLNGRGDPALGKRSS